MKDFREFIKENTVKTQTPDKSRAEFLMKESEQEHSLLLEIIEKMGVNDRNANMLVKSCYDILMGIIRAKMLLEGYNATGHGAHEAEVSYLRTLGFREKEVQFANQMRFFRNGMLYYGTILDKAYAEKALDFTEQMHTKLKNLTKKSTI